MSRNRTATVPESEYEYKEPATEGTVESSADRPFDKQATEEDARAQEFTVNDAADNAFPEELPDTDDLAAEAPKGAWDVGWYPGEVIEGFQTRSGFQIETSDNVSKKGDSRNITLALRLTNPAGDTRTFIGGFNYRVEDFTAEVVAAVKEARVNFAGMKEWPGEAKSLRRSSLSIGKISQFQKAVGFKFKRNREGHFLPGVMVGQKMDVHLTVNEETKFNEVNGYAKLGEETKKTTKRGARR